MVYHFDSDTEFTLQGTRFSNLWIIVITTTAELLFAETKYVFEE
jgi:hypothetical protein